MSQGEQRQRNKTDQLSMKLGNGHGPTLIPWNTILQAHALRSVSLPPASYRNFLQGTMQVCAMTGVTRWPAKQSIFEDSITRSRRCLDCQKKSSRFQAMSHKYMVEFADARVTFRYLRNGPFVQCMSYYAIKEIGTDK